MATRARCLFSNCQRSLSSPRDRAREEIRPCRIVTRLFSGAGEIAETAGEGRLERLITALPRLEVRRVQRHPGHADEQRRSRVR
jgi:hypothetical protein